MERIQTEFPIESEAAMGDSPLSAEVLGPLADSRLVLFEATPWQRLKATQKEANLHGAQRQAHQDTEYQGYCNPKMYKRTGEPSGAAGTEHAGLKCVCVCVCFRLVVG